jgi:4-alpha-glucanotransferase
VQLYLAAADAAVPEQMMRACLASVAQLAVIPLQDLLLLDSSARFNTPGTASEHNWTWRLPDGALTAALAAHYRSWNEIFGRLRTAGAA